MNRKTWASALALCSLSAIGGYVLHASAEGAPRMSPLFYSGSVSGRDGKALEGSHAVRVALFDKLSGGVAACSTEELKVDFAAGEFSLELPSGSSGCDAAVAAKSDLWTELTVDGNIFPRAKVGAVPYALQADHATTATTAQSVTGEQADRLGKLEARVAELEKGATPEGTLAQVNAALAQPGGALRWNYRLLSIDGGCEWVSRNNATNCICNENEIMVEGGGWAGVGNMLNSSRIFPPGSIPEDPSRGMTFSCVSPSGTGVQCQDVWAACVRAAVAH
jgi:hypothetical protein